MIMRRIIICLVMVGLCPLGAFAYNESVAAISFNPSRLGAYSHLKAVNTATLRGGVQVGSDQLSIHSKGTVTLQDSNHKCQTGNCQEANLNKITDIMPWADKTEGVTCGSGNDCTRNTRAITSAIMQGPTNSPAGSGYTISTVPTINGDSTVVHMQGGSFRATSGDSYIDEFAQGDALKALKVSAGQINFTNNLEARQSLKLGNITIKPKAGGNFQNYEFVERTTQKQEKVKVLAVKIL